mgnify:CR=1 FL=1
MAVDYDKIFMLFIEQSAGTISPEDAAFLEQQLSANVSAKKFWEQLESDGKEISLSEYIDHLDPLTEQAQLKGTIASNREHKIVRSRKIRRGISAAAIIIILFSSGWFFYTKNKKITDTKEIVSLVSENKNAVSLQLATGKTVALDNKTAQQVTVDNAVLNVDKQSLQFTSSDTTVNLLTIPQGENYSITLSDGTVVTLNAASSLKFPFHFGNGTRDVYLEGEAYFKVAKDRQHPFIVHTTLTKVEVVGTQFDVNTYHPNTVSTALIEGKVLTEASDGKPIPLEPGHAAVYSASKGFDVEAIDTDDVISWMKGIYYFHDLSFDDLTEKMERVYGVTIRIDNPSIAAKSVSGVMDRNNLTDLLQDLKTTTGINYYYATKELHIR